MVLDYFQFLVNRTVERAKKASQGAEHFHVHISHNGPLLPNGDFKGKNYANAERLSSMA